MPGRQGPAGDPGNKHFIGKMQFLLTIQYSYNWIYSNMENLSNYRYSISGFDGSDGPIGDKGYRGEDCGICQGGLPGSKGEGGEGGRRGYPGVQGNR